MKKFEITKEQIITICEKFGKDNSTSLRSNLTNHFKTILPEAFESELEVGRWYKEKRKSKLIICFTDVENGYGYGLNRIDEWVTDFRRNDKEVFELATPKEVETALINEAKKRGFVNGVIVEKSGINSDFNMTFYPIKENNLKYFHLLNILDSREGHIFDNGKWATIIPQPLTLEVTLDEIATMYGIDVNNLKIKK